MSEARRKIARITVRAEPSELAEMRERAIAAGLSVPEFLRRAALGRKINPAARATAETLRHLSKIGNNLNQLTYAAHTGSYNQRELSQTLDVIRSVAASLIGKGGAA